MMQGYVQDGCMEAQQNVGSANPPTAPISDAVNALCSASGRELLSYYGYDVSREVDAAALFAFLACFATLSYFALRIRT